MRLRLGRRRDHATALSQRLQRASPASRITRERRRCEALERRLTLATRGHIRNADQRLRSAARGLNGVSPLQTLERGYAIARDARGEVVRNADDVTEGSRIAVDLARGRLDCDVHTVHPTPPDRSPE